MPLLTSRARLVLNIACLCLTVVTLPRDAVAAEPSIIEQHSREFRISVDGKPRGTQTMTITRRSDQSDVVKGDAEVELNFVVYRYRYTSSGTETWKDGRLIQVSNEADYNGDRYVIQGSATDQTLNYEVNGESKKAPKDIWAASYWREPEAAKVGKKVRLLDSDKGRQLVATLERVGTETINVESARVSATHYRMRGDVEVDVWYDREGYISRQEAMESGHRTALDLVKIRKITPATKSDRQPPEKTAGR